MEIKQIHVCGSTEYILVLLPLLDKFRTLNWIKIKKRVGNIKFYINKNPPEVRRRGGVKTKPKQGDVLAFISVEGFGRTGPEVQAYVLQEH